MSLVHSTGVRSRDISLNTKIRKLFPKSMRVDNWQSFREVSGLADLPNLRFGRGVIFAPTTVNCLVGQEVTRMSEELNDKSDWSDDEVRSVVMMIISEQLGVKKFSDGDEFVGDLGLG